jgi:hypothetical protein
MPTSKQRVLFAVRLWLLTLSITVHAQAGPPALQQSGSAARLYSLAEREAQYQALSAMPAVDVEYRGHGRVRRVEGQNSAKALAAIHRANSISSRRYSDE